MVGWDLEHETRCVLSYAGKDLNNNAHYLLTVQWFPFHLH